MSEGQAMIAAANRVRVLVVDDSVVVRRWLADAISRDGELEVAGTAASGRLALAKLRQAEVDVVTLDVDMPEASGLETLDALRREHPKLPVLMCSALTERGATATLDALGRGASDYVTKPSAGERGQGTVAFLEELTGKLKALGRRPAPIRAGAPAEAVSARPAAGRLTRIEAVVLGVSTGGPSALASVVPALPADLPVPVLIVQHMPPVFTRMLADRLALAAKLPVREAEEGDPVEPGVVLIAPGDQHMRVARRGGRAVITLDRGPPENSCRPAVDVLFASVADAYGSAALGVVLTGMGKDGLAGCGRIRAAGGRVLVQDEQTSVVWGMPGFVAGAGLAEEVLPLGEIALAVIKRVRVGRKGLQR
jgi:two-component system chemotaxis response regulator CheB